MSKCYTCGAGFKGTVRDLLRLYKREGKDYYFYSLKQGGDVYLVSKTTFKKIFNEKLTTKSGKVRKGVEYAHVSEFNG